MPLGLREHVDRINSISIDRCSVCGTVCATWRSSTDQPYIVPVCREFVDDYVCSGRLESINLDVDVVKKSIIILLVKTVSNIASNETLDAILEEEDDLD